jgi:acetyl-CoA acyltransferase
MSEEIYVVGVGMTAFGKWPERSIKDLSREAVEAALADAGCAAGEIEAAFFSTAAQGAFDGQFMIPGQLALRPLGLGGIPVVNVENACASASTAFYLACMQLRAGEAEVAIAVGVEKMHAGNPELAFTALNGAWDVAQVDTTLAGLARLRGGLQAPPGDAPPKSVFMEVYASLAAQHMRLYGSTPRQFATVAAKNHGHSVHNERAQFRRAFTVEEVLAGRPVAWPLTVPMCAPISDGAAAAVLCRRSALHRFRASRSVLVRACVLASGSDRLPDEVDRHLTRLAAKRAYERAGLGPSDISVAEVHDATAVGEVIQIENLGLCEAGLGGVAAERGETQLGGRIPVNPSGGLECKGHPIGATGLGQTYELVSQLRGECGPRQVDNARFGIAENGGGFHGFEEAAACVTIFERVAS